MYFLGYYPKQTIKTKLIWFYYRNFFIWSNPRDVSVNVIKHTNGLTMYTKRESGERLKLVNVRGNYICSFCCPSLSHFIFQFQGGYSLTVTLQCKFYKENEVEHCQWGQAMHYLDYDCEIKEGSSHIDVLREKHCDKMIN